MRRLLIFLLCLLFVIPTTAQDTQTPEDIARERIIEAIAKGKTGINLMGLGLTKLPSEINGFPNLEELYLTENQLITFPTEIFQFTNLNILLLNDNQLNNLPPEIGNLRRLIILDLGRNQLKELPPEIGNLTALQILNLGNNQLDRLPSEIGNLTHLDELHLHDNMLSNLPPEIDKLQQLCFLNLGNNQIHHLPIELGQLQRLATDECFPLSSLIYNNPLISPPPEVVAQGTAAILDYLNHQAEWHVRQMVSQIAGGVGVVAIGVLALRWRHKRRKDKKKRE